MSSVRQQHSHTIEQVKSIQENSDKSPSSFTSPAQPALNRSQGAYSAFRFGDFRLLLLGLFIASLGEQMINVAIGWELYERTGSALVLGGVGLVMVIPIILLSLPAGHLTDRFNRKAIVIVSQVLSALGCVGLTVLSYTAGSLVLIYGCLLLIGIAVAFSSPATSTLLPQTVPEDVFQNAATWSSSASQLAAVLGPALGGFVIAISGRATPVYAINAGVALVFAVLIVPLRGRQREIPLSEQTTLASLLEGMRFLRSTQVILAAITLDMFAVLLGGATTLLPIYAKDILHVGPVGLGWLRAAPSVGALSMSICIAYAPSFKKAGRTLLWAVAGFGAATIVFGISHSFWLSLLMLLIMGGLDNISVVIRHTLVLMRTPDAMLGRISSVNSLFIAISNELGGFESGLAAQLFGPIIAVAGGGVGTILVVLCVALLWPEMRRLRTLGEPKVEDNGRLI